MYFIEEHLLDCHSMYSEQDFHCKISEIIPELFFFSLSLCLLGAKSLVFFKTHLKQLYLCEAIGEGQLHPCEVNYTSPFFVFLISLGPILR